MKKLNQTCIGVVVLCCVICAAAAFWIGLIYAVVKIVKYAWG